MSLRLVKLFIAISFLLVMVPNGKFSLFTWMMLLLSTFYHPGFNDYSGVIPALFVIGAEGCLFLFYNKRGRKNDIISIIAITILCIYVTSWLPAIIRYGSIMEYVLFINFIAWALVGLVISIRQLKISHT